jgi:hypothetical protein
MGACVEIESKWRRSLPRQQGKRLAELSGWLTFSLKVNLIAS